MTAITTLIDTERERWFLWLPVALGTGIAIYFALLQEPAPWLGGVLLGLSLILFLGLRKLYLLRLLSIIILFLSLGFAVAQWRTLSLNTPMLTEPVSARWIEGDISQIEMRPEDQRVSLINLSVPKNFWPKNIRLPNKIRFLLRGKLQPHKSLMPGQRIRVKVGLIPPGEPIVPGGFDFRRQAYFQGLGAVGFALSEPRVMGEKSGWSLSMERWRHSLTKKVRQGLPGDTGALAAAIITGDRSGIRDDLRQSFADSGLAHILAISGLHLSLLAGLVFFLIRRGLCLIPRIALDYPVKKWAAGATILASFGYLLLCGQPIPATRSFIMITIMMLAIMVDRSALSMRNVSLAALAILLLYPESLLGASFQLSFSAVVALIAFYEASERRWMQLQISSGFVRKCWLYSSGVMLTSLIASVATTPFTIYHFGRFPVYGILANLVAVPITSMWVMPWAITSVFSMLGEGQSGPLHMLGYGMSALMAIANKVASWPHAIVLLPAADMLCLLFTTIGGLWFCLWSQTWRWLGVIGPAIATVLLFTTVPPDLYIAAHGKVIGIRGTDNNLWLTNRQVSSFIKDNWQRHGGLDEVKRMPIDLVALNGQLYCSESSCHYLCHGHRVFFTRIVEAQEQHCSDVVINTTGRRFVCAESCLMIDQSALAQQGGYALWLPPNRPPYYRTIRQETGIRPWTSFIG